MQHGPRDVLAKIRPALTDAALPQLQHEVVGLRTPDLMRTTRGAVALPPGEERSDPFAERGSQRAGARASRASSSGMRKYAEVLYVGDLARRCSLVSIGSRWSITGTRGHRTGTPQTHSFGFAVFGIDLARTTSLRLRTP